MSQKNQARPTITVDSSALAAEQSNLKAPAKKRKEEAKETLYLKRI